MVHLHLLNASHEDLSIYLLSMDRDCHMAWILAVVQYIVYYNIRIIVAAHNRYSTMICATIGT